MVSFIPIKDLPLIKPGDDIGKLIFSSFTKIKENDILVITHTILSKAEGRVVRLEDIKPSKYAIRLAKKTSKDPRIVELILREAEKILRVGPGFIVTETKNGYVCANSGVDETNVEKGYAILLPEDPDRSAKEIRKTLRSLSNKDVAVIITDTCGRPFRTGVTGVCIGSSGIEPLQDRRGEKDLFGKELKITKVALLDNISCAANLIMGEASEGIPAVIVRGLKYKKSEKGSKDLIRNSKEDVFR